MRRCDLHTHSVYSDGTNTPEEILSLAEGLGLSAVALCDHNTVSGLPDFLQAAKGFSVEAIPGAEFSTEYEGTELHLVALCLTASVFPNVSGLMKEVNARKEESNRDLVARLARAGYGMNYDEILSQSRGNVNRALIAAEMVKRGYVYTVSEAFGSFLAPERGFYRPPKRLDALWLVGEIRNWGAVPILAHPLLSCGETVLRSFLSRSVPRGLVGMETRYSTYTPQEQSLAEKIAAEYGLLQSGGSDFHGSVKPDISLGSGRGDLCVPLEFWEKIKASVS